MDLVRPQRSASDNKALDERLQSELQQLIKAKLNIEEL
jgi:hypothetical protein